MSTTNKVLTITDGEKIRIYVLKEYLERQKRRDDISYYERVGYENTLKYIERIWGKIDD